MRGTVDPTYIAAELLRHLLCPNSTSAATIQYIDQFTVAKVGQDRAADRFPVAKNVVKFVESVFFLWCLSAVTVKLRARFPRATMMGTTLRRPNQGYSHFGGTSC